MAATGVKSADYLETDRNTHAFGTEGGMNGAPVGDEQRAGWHKSQEVCVAARNMARRHT